MSTQPLAPKKAGVTSSFRRPTLKTVIKVGLVVTLILVAYAAGGAASNSARESLGKADAQLSVLRAKTSVTDTDLSTALSQLRQARITAQQATSKAQAQAAAKYASAMSSVRGREQTLRSQERTVAAETGQLQASSISSDGVYVVGHDIRDGVWHTPGDHGQGGDSCYFATLGSTDTSNISDNNNFDGAETVDLSGAYAFQISGPCTWYRAS